MSLRKEDGLATTEWSMLISVALLLIFVPLQLGLRAHAFQVAQGAAQEAVSKAQASGATADDGIAAAEAFLAQAGNLSDATVTVTRTGDTVTVEIRGLAPRLVPGITLDIAVRRSGPVERFVPGSDR